MKEIIKNKLYLVRDFSFDLNDPKLKTPSAEYDAKFILNDSFLSEDNIKDMSLLASHVEKRIPGTTELPPELVLFPQDGMIPESELYIGENLLSYTFLGHGLTAHYKLKGENSTIRIFISLADSEQKAQKIKEDFRANINNPASIELSGKVSGVKGTMAYRGNAMIFNYRQYAFGCLGYTDEAGALNVLGKLHENLKE